MTSGGRRRIATWVHRASSPQPHAAAGGRKKRTGSARSLQGALPPASPARPGRYSRVILKCNNEVKPTGRHRHRHRHPARFYLHPLYLRFAAEKPWPALDPSPSRVSDVHVESFLLFFHLPCGTQTVNSNRYSIPVVTPRTTGTAVPTRTRARASLVQLEAARDSTDHGAPIRVTQSPNIHTVLRGRVWRGV